MKWYNRVFAIIAIVIAGMTGGAVLIMNWRIFALSIIAGLCLIFGISFWRNTFGDINLGREKGLWKVKLHPAILTPVIALAAGAAIAGVLLGALGF